MLVTGVHAAREQETPIYAARDAAMAVLEGLGYAAEAVAGVPLDGLADTELDPGRRLALRCAGATIGSVGEVAASLRLQADCPLPVGVFTIDITALLAQVPAPGPVAFHPPSRFPMVERAYTWVCPESLPYATLATAMRDAAGNWCRAITLDSLFRGPGLPETHKALSLRLQLQSDAHTLDEQQLTEVHQRIISQVPQRTGATLRA